MNNDKYLSVSSLNKYVKHKFDTDEHLQEVYIKGEISNFKSHSSGHYYFSVKDETSRIKAAMFRNSASKLIFMPTDGMSVLIKGKISVYEASGEYQITVSEMTEDGIGNLYVAYEQMKEKLNKEGLFDPKHKLDIPKYPKRVGVITASTGAAVRDIITTIKRRYPICEVLLLPCLVQGDGAKDQIAGQIYKAADYNIDVLIVGRGGGSIEDLWAFNEEIVVRAIYESKIPIISAVGHEIDFTIADYVSDLRAPTPTAAAEISVPNIIDILSNIEHNKLRVTKTLKNLVNSNYLKLKKLKESYVLKNPINIYQIKMQKLDNLIEKANSIIINKVDTLKLRLFKISSSYVLNNPKMLYDVKQRNLDKLISKCEILNPLSGLKRGYAIIKKEGIAISDIKKIKINDIIKIELNKGSINTKVLEVEEL